MARDNQNYAFIFTVFAGGMLLVDILFFLYPLMIESGMGGRLTYSILNVFVGAGFFNHWYTMKAWVLAIVVVSMFADDGKLSRLSWKELGIALGISLVLLFIPCIHIYQYVVTSVTGYILLAIFTPHLGRKLRPRISVDNSFDTFEQNKKPIITDYSINIPMKYRWKHKVHDGIIPIVNPFKATMVLGKPGSGKSFSVYKPIIRQMMDRHYTFFVYDYKYPTLSKEVYNNYLRAYGFKSMYDWKPGMKDKQGRRIPRFLVLNFNDPRNTHRCNPLHPDYIRDIADASEKAETIFRNACPDQAAKQDFFTMSAINFIAACIWFLKKYMDGRYCTFPHLIELLARNYEGIFAILTMTTFEDDVYDEDGRLVYHKGEDVPWRECDVLINPFKNALSANAQEQLQGQIASAQIPLSKFASPALYWVLSGNDFKLDVSNPDDPKILCVGNDPDRQTIYGTTHALYTSQMFTILNHPGNRMCGVLLDELPTIRLKGLDNIIATARSNKVAVVIGAQDKSQLIRDYKEQEANVIFNTIGNVFSGAVSGDTAKRLSELFGEEDRLTRSETTGGENDTQNTSIRKEKLLPQSVIENLSQGVFCGAVADEFEHKVDKKLFCCEIQISKEEMEEEKRWKDIPRLNAQDFKEDDIRRRFDRHDDYYCIEHLTDERQRKNIDDYTYKRVLNLEERTFSRSECAEAYRQMSIEERNALKKKVLDKILDNNVDTIVRENWMDIKNSMGAIFTLLSVEEFPKKKKSA